MKLSAAAKVGLVTVVALVAMVVSLSWLTQVSLRPKGYKLRAVFADVNGLMPGANVLLMGVKVGRVTALYPQDRTVVVDLEITDRQTRILEGSHFKILNKGIIGEKNLEIFPPEDSSQPTAVLAADSTVYGETLPRLENAIEQANKAVIAFRELAESPDTKLALKDGMKNFETAFADLRDLIRHTDEVAVAAQGFVSSADSIAGALSPQDLQAIVRDIRHLSNGLNKSYQALAGEGDQFDGAKGTLTNLKNLTARLEGIAAQVEQLSSDPKLKADMKDLVANSRKVVTQVGTLALNPPKLSPRFDLMGVQREPIHRSYGYGNFNFGLLTGADAFQVGVEGIGDDNVWNVTWGKPDFLSDGLGFHLGMVRSKIGIGLDWLPTSNVEVRGEVYDPAALSLRLAASYYPDWWDQKYGITAAWIRTMSTNDTQYFIGGQWRPLD